MTQVSSETKYCPDSMCQGPEEGRSQACFKTVRAVFRDGVLRAQWSGVWDRAGESQRPDEARPGKQVIGLGLILPVMGSELGRTPTKTFLV